MIKIGVINFQEFQFVMITISTQNKEVALKHAPTQISKNV